MDAKPFIKYCGGKKKLTSYILYNLPSEFNNYFEPFVGGGSVFYTIINKFPSKSYMLSDINNNLINCYKVIKNDNPQLINELKNDKYSNTRIKYDTNRQRFNSIKCNDNENDIERAALFIYLNKCCFNGLYRENLKSEFNVPFGKMKNPVICDESNLESVNKVLCNVELQYCEYQYILEFVKPNDFVYLDPPYYEKFSDYTSKRFNQQYHLKLKNFVDKLTDIGAHVMLSNSNTDFIRNLYKNYVQVNINVKYSIGGIGTDRDDNKQELLITNYTSRDHQVLL